MFVLLGVAALLLLGSSSASASTAQSGPDERPADAPEKAPIKVALPQTSADRRVVDAAAYVVEKKQGGQVKRDLQEAKRKAQPMADHIRSKGTAYDRALLAVWQALAGLVPDGLYGPATRAALISAGARNVPANLFRGAR